MAGDNDLIGSHFSDSRQKKRTAMRTALLGGLIALSLFGCSSYDIRGKLDQSVDRYNDLVRRHKLDAASLFASEALSKEFIERAEAANNIRMADYRVVAVKYDEKKNEAEVKVEIDYYSLSAYRLKTVVDVQKWAYREEGGSKQWRLISLLPEFK